MVEGNHIRFHMYPMHIYILLCSSLNSVTNNKFYTSDKYDKKECFKNNTYCTSTNIFF